MSNVDKSRLIRWQQGEIDRQNKTLFDLSSQIEQLETDKEQTAKRAKSAVNETAAASDMLLFCAGASSVLCATNAMSGDTGRSIAFLLVSVLLAAFGHFGRRLDWHGICSDEVDEW